MEVGPEGLQGLTEAQGPPRQTLAGDFCQQIYLGIQRPKPGQGWVVVGVQLGDKSDPGSLSNELIELLLSSFEKSASKPWIVLSPLNDSWNSL